MTFYRAQVELERDTGQAEDRTVHAYHFSTNDVGTPTQEQDDIIAALTLLYTDIDGFLSRELSGVWRIKMYDLEDVPPRVPARDVTPAGLVVGSSALPSQMALVCNVESFIVGGQPRARQVGRLFIGPLTQVDQDLVGESGASSTLINAVGNAFGARLLPVPNVNSGSQIAWCVWSRRDTHDSLGAPYTGPGSEGLTYTLASLSNGFRSVVRVRINNTYGVIRKRRVGSGQTFTTFT